ncbi:MAG: Zn-ribbon domain-containing OB-fold protein [Chloroflexota bacterium]|nr:Zn-ribbon domain-containing OB-fold protein [Chloroflexota bacterium]
MSWNKPLPNVDADNQPFWEGLRRHEFLVFRCKRCGRSYWPVAYCRACPPEPFYGNMEWVPASGRGRIFAFNVHRFAFHPGFADELPYVYALIELAEGPMYGTNVVGCDPAEVRIGMPVEVVYRDVTPDGDAAPFTLADVRPVAG